MYDGHAWLVSTSNKTPWNWLSCFSAFHARWSRLPSLAVNSQQFFEYSWQIRAHSSLAFKLRFHSARKTTGGSGFRKMPEVYNGNGLDFNWAFQENHIYGKETHSIEDVRRKFSKYLSPPITILTFVDHKQLIWLEILESTGLYTNSTTWRQSSLFCSCKRARTADYKTEWTKKYKHNRKK